MAEAADVSMTPTIASDGIESNGSNCCRTMASSSRPTRILVASSRDTNQLPAAKKIPNNGRGIIQIHEITWPAKEFRGLADCGEVDGWWQPADCHVDVGPRSQAALSSRPKDENLSRAQSEQQGRRRCEHIGIDEHCRHSLLRAHT